MIIMDIEGSELTALRGMAGTLTRHSVEVFMEVHADLLRANGQDEEMIDKFFKGIGYSKEVLREPNGLAFEHKQKHVRFYKENALVLEETSRANKLNFV
jgi:hypothetical protein